MSKPSAGYSQIRFIGYAVPTTPAGIIPAPSLAYAGTYLGDPNTFRDIRARVAILKNAVNTAKVSLPKDPPGTVINVFVAPEFFFNGPLGAYVFNPLDGEQDPVVTLQTEVQKAFPAKDYADWTFVCGTAPTAQVVDINHVFNDTLTQVRNSVVQALTEQWHKAYGAMQQVVQAVLVEFIKNCRDNPSLAVRNRSLIVSNIGLGLFDHHKSINALTTEKAFASYEDFVLYEPNGKSVITEQMVTYPTIDLSNGDLKRSSDDRFAIFRQSFGGGPTGWMNFGIEICLDHNNYRLRRNVGNNPFHPAKGQMSNSPAAIRAHLIPSCGGQIVSSAIVAGAQGFVFNCDGQYPLGPVGNAGKPTAATNADQNCNMNCLFTDWVDTTNSNYAAHTQFALVKDAAFTSNPNNQNENATLYPLKVDGPNDIKVVNVDPPLDVPFAKYFASGPGAIHIYGANHPFELAPVLKLTKPRS